MIYNVICYLFAFAVLSDFGMDTTDTHLGFTVSPEKLSLDPNTLVRDASLIALQETYISKNSFNKIYFEHSNCPEAIIAFCESMFIPKYRRRYASQGPLFLTDKDVFLALLPQELQLKILKYCNIYPDDLYNPYLFNNNPFAFNFVGFLNEESVYVLKHKTFHFKDFNIEPDMPHRTLNVSFNNLHESPLSPMQIVSTLKNNHLIPPIIPIGQNYWHDKYTSSKNCKYTIEFQVFSENLCFPFCITPLFTQKNSDYLRKIDYTDYINILGNEVTFADNVESIFHLCINKEVTLLITELFHINKNTNFKENHRIEIYEYNEEKNSYTSEDIKQKIDLPLFSKKSINQFRFIIKDVYRHTIILYDKKYNLHSCFSLLENKYLTYENQAKHNSNLLKIAAFILLSYLYFHKETIVKKIEETKIKNESRNKYDPKSNKTKRPNITEKIAKSIAPTIIIILSLYKIYRARYLLYNDLKSILNYILAPLYKTMHYQKV